MMGNIEKSRPGLTLIELILSIAIIGIILISFMPLFVVSAKNNSQSESTLNTTYIGKDAMELAYHLSQTISYNDLKSTLVAKGYKDLSGDAYGIESSDEKYIHMEFTKAENKKLVKVLVKIYKDQNMMENQVEVQYESLYIWDAG